MPSPRDQPDPAPKRKPVIGVIGGIGSGKSTVARRFAERACGVIDADAIAKAALDRPEVLDQLVAWWGDDVLSQRADGSRVANRAAIAKRVFQDPAERERLEGLIHPLVHAQREAERERLAGDDRFVAIIEDTPLLIESGLADSCDAIVFVHADETVRRARVASRGWSGEELARREKWQAPLDRKRAAADYVINNNAGDAELDSHVRRVLSEILHPHETDGDRGSESPQGSAGQGSL